MIFQPSSVIIYKLLINVPLAQLDRASDYGSEGREFESSAARQEKTANFDFKIDGLFNLKCKFKPYLPFYSCIFDGNIL